MYMYVHVYTFRKPEEVLELMLQEIGSPLTWVLESRLLASLQEHQAPSITEPSLPPINLF